MEKGLATPRKMRLVCCTRIDLFQEWSVQGAKGIGIGYRVTVRGLAWILLLCSVAVCEQPKGELAGANRPESNAGVSSDAGRSVTKISVTSDLVVIPVTVTDGKGRVVNGLQKEHFTLYEDKVEQAIAQFAAEDAPVSIGLVFDSSGSMGPKLQKAREAVAALLNNANPEDEFFLVQFNQRAELVVGLTTQSEEIPRPPTSLYPTRTPPLLIPLTP